MRAVLGIGIVLVFASLVAVFLFRFGDPARSGEVGVKLAGESVLIRIKPCSESASVHTIRVRRVSDDRIIWQVDSQVGSSEALLVLGTAPSGFDEMQPLGETLDLDDRYVIAVSLGRRPAEDGN